MEKIKAKAEAEEKKHHLFFVKKQMMLVDSGCRQISHEHFVTNALLSLQPPGCW